MAKSVKVVFLGGVGEIGKNMTALEFGDDIIIVDCGVEFPREDSPGIDAIIPDITYIRDNLKKLRGIVLTHGHEDHIGALPYYADELKVPVYGTALTLGLLERKLSERGIKAQLNRVKPGDEVEMGCFKVEFIKVAHSMAGACALSVTTPVGVVFITGDFKIDNTTWSARALPPPRWWWGRGWRTSLSPTRKNASSWRASPPPITGCSRSCGSRRSTAGRSCSRAGA